MKPYFGFFIGESLSLYLFPLLEPIINAFFLLFIPVVVYRKTPAQLGFKNFGKGFLYGLTALMFLPFLRIIPSPAPFIDGFSQAVFFKGFFYSVFENEMLFPKVSRLNLISSFLYFLVFFAVSGGSFYALSFFAVSFISGLLYEESGSIVSPIIFHVAFLFSSLSAIL
ncbi:CPBP family glutamic-type intramembrane protease [Desulfurobacterium atlanticum]|uniref:CAAX prenyl protease 2/Lysostaphin resistance protein A-like domain-containing protein n=1 Tax=Desulfurobacterium atlanticum TaxID=240169 RepID=A0A238YMV4_9BACT|nr:CPBP family glutamic-type intramembrane protease [Desulfurobacterium atlanticum]SNR71943.1 hypothetical protein SAMN06265340_10410 [Desulfurobacterium atlanticum]